MLSADSFWGFKPNDDGNVIWEQILGPVSTTPFSHDVHRITNRAFTNDGHRAYYVGGFYSAATSPNFEFRAQNAVSRFLSFDFDTHTIKNSNDGGYFIPHQTAIIAWPPKNMINISMYGDNGILIILPSGSDCQNFAFNNIILYVKKNGKWYFQFALGDTPNPKSRFCAVGIEGNNQINFEM